MVAVTISNTAANSI